MLLNEYVSEHMKTNNRSIIYSPERYLPLANAELMKHSLTYEKIPPDIQKKYNSSYIFKSVIGKHRNAYVILNDKIKIVDINLK